MRNDIRRFIEEDVGFGDITTEAMGDLGELTGNIVAGEECVLAGMSEAAAVFSEFGISVTPLASDGDTVIRGTTVATVFGDATGILTGERLALNFLMQMSGIATMTRRFVGLATEANPNVRVAATRKTTPGFRRYQKRAVALGGGDTHRIRLDDMFLIKDNHIEATGSVTAAVKLARRSHFSKKVEVEAKTFEEALEAAEAGADIIMLDNMTPREGAVAAGAVRKVSSKTLIEVSGGITEETIAEYAAFADIVSVGALTHSYRSIDFSMSVKRV